MQLDDLIMHGASCVYEPAAFTWLACSPTTDPLRVLCSVDRCTKPP